MLDMLGMITPWADVCVTPNACLLQTLANSTLFLGGDSAPNLFLIIRENWGISAFLFCSELDPTGILIK